MANSMDGQNSILSVVGPLGTTVRALRLTVKSLLSTQPWLHDPLVHELPWRDEQEEQFLKRVGSADLSGKLAFGVLKHDGLVSVTPPVRRAIDTVAKKMESLGHEVIEWKPPSHKHLLDTAVRQKFPKRLNLGLYKITELTVSSPTSSKLGSMMAASMSMELEASLANLWSSK